MKKAGRIILIVLLAAVCLSAFGGGISKVIGGISPGGGGVAIAGDATSEPFTTKANREPSKLRIKYYDKSVDDQPYIPGWLTPDFGDVTWLTISELSAMKLAMNSDATTPLYCKISTAQDLVDLGDYATSYYRLNNVHFVQTANIDLAGKPGFWIGADDSPFTGYYYGCGWKILNYTFDPDPTATYNGLFGVLQNATISGVYLSHLRYEFPNVNCALGALASYAVDSNISYCYIEDAVLTCSDERNAAASGSTIPAKTAALIGEVSGATTVKYCRVLNSTLECPAFVGYVGISSVEGGGPAPASDTDVTLYGCVNEAEITDAVYAAPFIGDIHDEVQGVYLTLCTNWGNVTAKAGNNAGGLIHWVGDYKKLVRVDACINYGDVSGKIAGGLASHYSGQSLEVSNFVNYGKITGGDAAGGVIGEMSLEGGTVNFECNVSAGNVAATSPSGTPGAFFGTFNIDAEGSGTLFSQDSDNRRLYNFAIPGTAFVGKLSYDGAAATDAQRRALEANHFFYHHLKVPADPETLRTTGDDADLLFYGFLNSNGTYGFCYSGERFYPGIQTDGRWEFVEHDVAVWGYDE